MLLRKSCGNKVYFYVINLHNVFYVRLQYYFTSHFKLHWSVFLYCFKVMDLQCVTYSWKVEPLTLSRPSMPSVCLWILCVCPQWINTTSHQNSRASSLQVLNPSLTLYSDLTFFPSCPCSHTAFAFYGCPVCLTSPHWNHRNYCVRSFNVPQRKQPPLRAQQRDLCSVSDGRP